MRRRRRALWVLLALAALGLGVFLIPTVWLRPWSIEHLYARVFVEYALAHPMLLSQLRILEPWGIRFHNDELDDFSPAAAEREAARARRNLELLRSYPKQGQPPAQRLSTEVLEWYLAVRVDGERFLLHDLPLNQLDGVHSALPDFMLNVHGLADERDARDYVERLRGFGRALDQVLEGVHARAARGLAPPRFVVERLRGQLEDLLAAAPAEHLLVRELERRLAALPGLAEGRREALVADARAAVAEVVLPAYRRVAAALPALEAAARPADGVWSLPDGDAYYAWTLRLHTTTELGAGEIHRLGLAEVARIQGEARAILEAEGRPAGDLGEALAELGRNPRFLYPDDEEGRARILADYQAIVDETLARLPALFGRLPRAPVRVARVPAFKEAGAPGAYYQPPALDGSRPGTFFANLRSVAELPRFGMRTLTYHEAVPGHHLQIALALELRGVPFFRRVVPFTAFSEGWALYAERLAAEAGLHPTPWDRLGALQAELFRAVRLVVDTGLHAKRWSREQAIGYMARESGMALGDVSAEVERYIVDPGQACAYKVGQLELLRLRERARAAQGPRFDLREFHDLVLGQGALPLVVLERVVEEWLEERSSAGARPYPRAGPRHLTIVASPDPGRREDAG
jgi:uncharacterized protein (DUF885 family)